MSPPPLRQGKKLPAAPQDKRDAPAHAERLQKVLAAAGLGSRRQCEQLIEEGRVEIDRRVVDELGVRVDPSRQEIRVDGTPLPRTRRIYYAVHKPRGVVCTNRDPEGRTRVVDLAPDGHRLFPVGRLDRMSEGLILLTNDGELANQLTHPRYGVEKTYRVVVAGHPEPVQLRALEQGVRLAEGLARVKSVRVVQRRRQCTELEIVLNEGRNREIRRLLARTGHKVLRLLRIAVGSVRLGEMPAGAYRPLSRDEVKKLQHPSPSRESSKTEKPRRRRRGDETRGQKQAPKGARPTGEVQSRPPQKPRSAVSGPRRKTAKRNKSNVGAPPRPARPAKGRRR